MSVSCHARVQCYQLYCCRHHRSYSSRFISQRVHGFSNPQRVGYSDVVAMRPLAGSPLDLANFNLSQLAQAFKDRTAPRSDVLYEMAALIPGASTAEQAEIRLTIDTLKMIASVEPDRLFFLKYLWYRGLGDTHSCQGQKTRSQTSKGLAVSALRARPSSFQKTLFHHVEFLGTRVNPSS